MQTIVNEMKCLERFERLSFSFQPWCNSMQSPVPSPFSSFILSFNRRKWSSQYSSYSSHVGWCEDQPNGSTGKGKKGEKREVNRTFQILNDHLPRMEWSGNEMESTDSLPSGRSCVGLSGWMNHCYWDGRIYPSRAANRLATIWRTIDDLSTIYLYSLFKCE